MLTLGERIASLLDTRGWSWAQLAVESECSADALSRIRRGETIPLLERRAGSRQGAPLTPIATALGISVVELLRGTKYDARPPRRSGQGGFLYIECAPIFKELDLESPPVTRLKLLYDAYQTVTKFLDDIYIQLREWHLAELIPFNYYGELWALHAEGGRVLDRMGRVFGYETEGTAGVEQFGEGDNRSLAHPDVHILPGMHFELHLQPGYTQALERQKALGETV